MTIVVANYARAVMPGVYEFFGSGFNRYQTQWSELYQNAPSEKNFEEVINTYGLGLMKLKPETAPIQYDTMGQAWPSYFKHQVYALGYPISKEAIEDNLYEQLSYQRAEALGISAAQTMENLGASPFNNGFSGAGSYNLGDGLSLFNTAHLLSKGGTFSNTVSSGTHLSEASLENALIQISKWTDDAGNKIALKGRKLIIPPDLDYEAQRIIGNSQWRPGTMDRDIPAMKSLGRLPEGYVINNYLSSTSAYFIQTDSPSMAKRWIRREPNMTNDTPDFETDVMKFKCDFRVIFGIYEPRNYFGNPGA